MSGVVVILCSVYMSVEHNDNQTRNNGVSMKHVYSENACIIDSALDKIEMVKSD